MGTKGLKGSPPKPPRWWKKICEAKQIATRRTPVEIHPHKTEHRRRNRKAPTPPQTQQPLALSFPQQHGCAKSVFAHASSPSLPTNRYRLSKQRSPTPN